MGAVNINLDEKFVFTAKARMNIGKVIAAGLILLAFGIFGLSQGWFDPAPKAEGHGETHSEVIMDDAKLLASHAESDQHEGHSEAHAGGHHGYHWSQRVIMNLWQNNVWFLGIALIGVFFVCVNYIAWAGWNAAFKRVHEAFGYYLIVAAPITLILLLIGGKDIFHFMHEGIMDPNSSNYDAIIAGKSWWLGTGFYYGRIIFYFVAWIAIFMIIRKLSIQEDEVGGDQIHQKIVTWSGFFVWIFGITTSTGAWDLIMAIDTHWFSTLFGWWTFSSWFVSGLCVIALLIIYLKEAGYLSGVSTEHLHDLGKYIFAFSIFWSYLWFSQFLLYWYANIPEEVFWFNERMFYNNGNYTALFILNIIINFLFPFLYFMTRDAKRSMTLLKVGAFVLLFGHWIDFYLMVTPGTLKEHGGLNLGMLFVELGTTMIFAGIFLYTVLHSLAKAGIYPKNHPMLQESLNHHT